MRVRGFPTIRSGRLLVRPASFPRGGHFRSRGRDPGELAVSVGTPYLLRSSRAIFNLARPRSMEPSGPALVECESRSKRLPHLPWSARPIPGGSRPFPVCPPYSSPAPIPGPNSSIILGRKPLRVSRIVFKESPNGDRQNPYPNHAMPKAFAHANPRSRQKLEAVGRGRLCFGGS